MPKKKKSPVDGLTDTQIMQLKVTPSEVSILVKQLWGSLACRACVTQR